MQYFRYTLTYTPSQDRIVPTPPKLYVKVRNSSGVALRAAYLHGPYTLYAACYPSTFDPNHPHGSPEVYGYPQFEGNLKAGSSWNAELTVPEDIHESFVSGSSRRQSAGEGGSATWIIEIASQVLFSSSAAVNYEVLIARDERSVDFGFAGMGGVSHAAPGTLSDFQERRKDQRPGAGQIQGIYSKAIGLLIDDTASLWNSPTLPGEEKEKHNREKLRANPVLSNADPTNSAKDSPNPRALLDDKGKSAPKKSERQKIHLVLLTHGLHSNLGADMLYLKESIDATAKQARMDRSMRLAKEKAQKATDLKESCEREDQKNSKSSTAPLSGGQEDLPTAISDGADGDEQVIVRGFPGNAVRTERGIQYLGKRLAKYLLAMTYPDQPYLPVKKKSMTKTLSNKFGSGDKDPRVQHGQQTHGRSTIRKEPVPDTNLAYQITSISFIGHSLGGLVQTYAIAYIQKHSPEFFQLIKPINFIALATPFLGLSNENPLYVKFALDFGLVGRTGQDLGLTWRAPTMVRSGWGAMIAGIGSEGQRKKGGMESRSKPLLRILPSGPAHQVLRMFRNRTVYSNVVNDGIVPLRTSCLLFLDWRGLGRVENARRDNGLVGTMAGWGWAELTGQNSTGGQPAPWKAWFDSDDSTPERMGTGHNGTGGKDVGATVPQPSDDAVQDHANVSAPSSPVDERRGHFSDKPFQDEEYDEQVVHHKRANSDTGSSPFSGLLSLLKPAGSSNSKAQHHEPKHAKIYKRSQTVKFDADDSSATGAQEDAAMEDPVAEARPGLARGESALGDDSVIAPPKTSVFESAGDILNPPLPTREYLTDPLNRPRTIFHDRVYHPEDIPAPPSRSRTFFMRRTPSSDGRKLSADSASTATSSSDGTGNMKVEEKIARAYHRDLSWRKVLVRLEPDAHNNIVVRRMFSNAYGWPVVKHIVDTHFSDSPAARLADSKEAGVERAKPMDEQGNGQEVKDPLLRRTIEARKQREADKESQKNTSRASNNGADVHSEERDSLPDLVPSPLKSRQSSMRTGTLSRQDSAAWDDGFFNSDEEDEDDFEQFAPLRSIRRTAGLEMSGGAGQESDDTDEVESVSSGLKIGGSKLKGTNQEGPRISPATIELPTPVVVPVLSANTSDIGLRKSLEEQMQRSKRQQERQGAVG